MPVNAPGFQVYDVAPVALKVAVEPIQIKVGLALTVKVGNVLTVNDNVVVVEQTPLSPVTV